MSNLNINMGKLNDPKISSKMLAHVNNIVQLAHEKLTCDDACQFERKSNELKEKYERAAEVKQNIPTIYNEREKDYIVFTKGVPYYDNMMEHRYEAAGRESLNEMLIIHKHQMKILHEELENYANGTLYEQNISDLWKKYEQEEKLLKLATLKMQNNIAISDRETSYEDVENTKITKYRNIALFLYCFVLFVFLVLLIAKGRYMEIKLWVVFICLVLFPFIKTILLKSGTTFKNNVKSLVNNVYLEDENDDCDVDTNPPALSDSLNIKI